MRRREASLNVRVSLGLRQRFKKKCKEQGTTIQATVPELMKRFIDGELSFAFNNNGTKNK